VAQVYQYYLQVHGRKGLDNKNTPIDSFVHVGKGYNNAFYNGGLLGV
jgi:Zn-dependent metalloprotease